jgi:hypothetical protein
MRRILLRLYPDSWRRRYGDEFESILEDRSLTPAEVADVVHGAVDAHLRVRGRSFRGLGRFGTRAIGTAAILGGLVWSAGFFLASFDASGRPWAIRGIFGVDPTLGLFGSPVIIAGTSLLLLALVGLGASKGRAHPRLIWACVLVPIIGTLISLFALFALPATQVHINQVDGSELSYVLDLMHGTEIRANGMLVMVAGTVLFSLATLPSWPGAILLAGSSLMLAMVFGGEIPATRELMKASWYLGFFYVGLAAFAVGWVATGVAELRGRPGVVSVQRVG